MFHVNPILRFGSRLRQRRAKHISLFSRRDPIFIIMSYQTGLTQPLLDDVDRRLVQQRNDDMRQIGTNTIFTP